MDLQFLSGLGVDEAAAAAIIEAAQTEADERLKALGTDAEARRLRDKFGYALCRSLERMGARNIKAAGAALDFEWDGNDFDDFPCGLLEAVEKLRLEAPYLFFGGVGGVYEDIPAHSFVGIVPVEPSDEELPEISYSEYMRLKRGV